MLLKIPRDGARFLFFFGLFLAGCGGDKGDSSARFTLNTPPFPEVQEMAEKVSVSLEIAGKTCLLTIDADWTLDGQCPDLPTGVHPFALRYRRDDLAAVIASAAGTATLTPKNTTGELEIKTLKKDQDDDADGHSNLSEAQFGTNPKDPASKPAMPAFAPLLSFDAGSDPRAVALGDLNGDSVLDVITANGGDDTVSVLLGNGDGTFKAAKNFPTGAAATGPRVPTEIVLTPLNADAHLDIVVINSGEGGSHPGDLAVLLGNGDGTFQTAVSHATGSQPSALALGDLDVNGTQDAVTGNFDGQNLSVLLGNTNGTFQAALAPIPVGDVTALALGQLDADNTLDLAVSVQTERAVKILKGNGDGTFQAGDTISLPDGIVISVALKDLNGDGPLDLIAAFAADKIAVLLGIGNGTFQAPVFFKAGRSPGSLAFADLDGDGNLDIVTENEGEGVAAVLRGKGGGSFQSPVFFEAGGRPGWVALGDLNGDPGFDFVLTDRSSNKVSVLVTK